MQYYMHKWLTHKWETDSRFYTASVTQNLFGDWEINCRWGSKHNNKGGKLTRVANSYDQALNILAAIDKRRVQRKYQRAVK